MEKKNKKQWKKPELVVIIRSNPEEYVLFACFTAPVGGICGNEQESRVAGS